MYISSSAPCSLFRLEIKLCDDTIPCVTFWARSNNLSKNFSLSLCQYSTFLTSPQACDKRYLCVNLLVVGMSE